MSRYLSDSPTQIIETRTNLEVEKSRRIGDFDVITHEPKKESFRVSWVESGHKNFIENMPAMAAVHCLLSKIGSSQTVEITRER